MRRTLAITAALVATAGCSAPGRPSRDSQVLSPLKITNFNILYETNCAGCHGRGGKGGAAIGIGDPVYLVIADDASIRRVVDNGVPGTAMPAFAETAGGMLTNSQVETIVTGIRSRWARPGALQGETPPPYAAQQSGDPNRGANVYSVYCSSCHGADARGGPRASSIVDPSYLSLVSDQYLRTTVIVGRPELGAPDWRGDVPGKAMSNEEVSDVVTWLAAHRPQVTSPSLSSAKSEAGGIQ